MRAIYQRAGRQEGEGQEEKASPPVSLVARPRRDTYLTCVYIFTYVAGQRTADKGARTAVVDFAGAPRDEKGEERRKASSRGDFRIISGNSRRGRSS